MYHFFYILHLHIWLPQDMFCFKWLTESKLSDESLDEIAYVFVHYFPTSLQGGAPWHPWTPHWEPYHFLFTPHNQFLFTLIQSCPLCHKIMPFSQPYITIGFTSSPYNHGFFLPLLLYPRHWSTNVFFSMPSNHDLFTIIKNHMLFTTIQLCPCYIIQIIISSIQSNLVVNFSSS